jgi:hypothetical protein
MRAKIDIWQVPISCKVTTIESLETWSCIKPIKVNLSIKQVKSQFINKTSFKSQLKSIKIGFQLLKAASVCLTLFASLLCSSDRLRLEPLFALKPASPGTRPRAASPGTPHDFL